MNPSKTGGCLALLAVASLLGCEAEREPLFLDWLDASVAVHDAVDEGIRSGPQLLGPWTEGLAGRADETGVVWTLADRVSIPFEWLGSGPREFVLDALPPAGQSTSAQILLDGVNLGERQWSAPGRVGLELPTELRGPGIHRVELLLEAGSTLGIRAAGTRVPDEARERWRWSPMVEGSRLELAGTSSAPGMVEVFVDKGGGQWIPLWSLEYGGGESIRHSLELRQAALTGVARVAVHCSGGKVEWQRLRQTLPAPRDLDRRNVVIISLDTTRWDALGAFRSSTAAPENFGVNGSATPHLDELAAGATLWTQALSPAPVTGPTHASLLLSQPPRAHGLDGNGKPMPLASRGNLAAYLEAWGYRNAAFVSLGVLKADLGFAQGFQHFSDELGGIWSRPADRVRDSFQAWLNAELDHDEVPRFVWLHFSDPHMPYGQPGDGGALLSWDGGERHRLDGTGRAQRFDFYGEPGRHSIRFHALPESPRGREFKLLRFRIADESIEWSFGRGFREGDNVLLARPGAEIFVGLPEGGPPGIRLEVGIEDALSDLEQRQRYAKDVEFMDAALGQCLDWMREAGWLDDALICVFADHGEDIGGRDGRWGHVEHVRPSLSRVPLFLLDPREGAETRRDPAGIVDLAPTLAGRLGLPALPSWSGADLYGDTAARALHLESLPPEAAQNWRALIRGNYKLEGLVGDDGLPQGELRLYDLLEDPLCRENLLAARGRSSGEFDELIAEWSRWIGAAPEGSEQIDPRMEERLRALGYLD